MDVKLDLIRDILQDFAESLANILRLEITIADRNFIRIVGTGEFKNRIFQQLPKGSAYRTAIVNSTPLILDQAVTCEYCNKCQFKKKCLVMAEVCAPITVENEVIGVVGIVALNHIQKSSFLEKRIDYFNIVLKLAKLIETIFEFQLIKETSNLISGVKRYNEVVTFDMILSKSNKMLQTIALAKNAALYDVNVLIIGETGTGKEVFAKAIHSASPRAGGNFEPINCSAIPENLLESELFGYDEGAFTGARRDGKIGKFQLAHNGTLYLDEIESMPLNLQAKLLRVLEEKYIIKLGGIKHISVNTRIIAAVKQDLRELVREGKFREDLFYRLNVFPIIIPPLRERMEDLDLLIKTFLKKYSILLKKSITSIDEDLLSCLSQHAWPGNIRELENLIEYGICLETTAVLREDTVQQQLEKMRGNEMALGPLSQMVKNFERRLVKETMDKCKKDKCAVGKVAKVLGISKASVYRKLDNSQY